MSDAAPRNSTRYQVLLTGLLSLNFGFVLFDRNAVNFLMPFIQPELGLSNTQVGLLSSGLSLTWALSALGIGVLADRIGSRKALLVWMTLLFSLCSFGSGLATSFALLLAARLLMGMAEGGIMPVSQAMLATEIAPQHRGLAMGVAQGFGSSLMGSFVAPVLLVVFATAFGWRHSFFLAGLPGLVMALLLWRCVREPRVAQVAVRTQTAGSLRDVLRDRNVLLSAVIGILLVSYLVVCWAFMPLYLTQVRGYDAATMGWLMGALGISATVASTAVPALSDRIGRLRPMLLFPALGLLLPLGALYYEGSTWTLALLFVAGWSVTGVFPLFMATIPSESVAPVHVATALGFCMGISEIIGGVLSPFLAGVAADHHGLHAPLWMLAGFTSVAAVLALGLRETAPRLVAVHAPH